MRILLAKISDDRHALKIIGDGRSERVELETKSLLTHDFLHYAIESLAGLDGGFWGAIAEGKTLAEMNDRTGEPMKGYALEMRIIEPIVGAMSGVVRGVAPAMIIAGLDNLFSAQNILRPTWLDVSLIERVQERMRKLLGEWRSTAYGSTMELSWPSS